jgi:hypothetical protein
MRSPILVALVLGAFFGASIGLMFDSKRDPGVHTLIGVLAGIVLAAIALYQLQRCDPWRRFHED